MVTLKNLERRMATYNLDHPSHARIRKFPVVVQPKKGPSIGVMKGKRTFDSLTLLARETREGLPSTILECSEIVSGIRARRLQVIEKPKPQPKPKSQPQTNTPPSGNIPSAFSPSAGSEEGKTGNEESKTTEEGGKKKTGKRSSR